MVVTRTCDSADQLWTTGLSALPVMSKPGPMEPATAFENDPQSQKRWWPLMVV